jgi:hypothetical protein
MVTGSLIKIVITLAGLLWTIGLLIVGLIRKNKKKLKHAGLIFAGTWTLLIIITVVEFLIASK